MLVFVKISLSGEQEYLNFLSTYVPGSLRGLYTLFSLKGVGSERLSKLLKMTTLVSDVAGTQSRSV